MPRILIVDDNESIHQDFKKVLTNHSADKLRSVELELFGEDDPDILTNEPNIDYHIDDAFQGEDAINMVERAQREGKPYALIFMDVRMPPGIDGIQTASKIWQHFPQIEMVICSAHSDYSWQEMVQQIGISDKLQFLRKPFDMVTVQQLALSCTKKWELIQSYELELKKLMVQKENIEKELSQKRMELNHTRELLQVAEKRLKAI